MVLLIFVVGYGLQVTRDVINGGTGLPKVLPKKIVVFGVEGIVLKGIYFIIQGFLLMIISIPLNFPAFDLENSL